MLFNSFPFFVLLAVTLVLFYLPPLRSQQTRILILSSLVFYAWEAPWLLLLLLGSIAVNTLLSWLLASGPQSRLVRVLTAGLIFNLLIIALFKYGPLLVRSLGIADRGLGHTLATLPLPIGISFYTFESISLLVDLFRQRRDEKPPFIPPDWRTHFEHTALFVAFFPHLISGPILKAHQFYPQIVPRFFRDIRWNEAFKLCVLGFFLKCVVADNLKDQTSELLFSPKMLSVASITLLTTLVGYSVQIFSDFAGYSLIALGVALLFGYRLPQNFDFPYIAASLGEFWRRWHISLSTWLREYLYYPLGGNRLGPARTYVNLFIVMALGGMWHGAAWSFMIWGLYHGIGLAAERWLLDRHPQAYDRIPKELRIAGVFTFVTFGWLLFKFPDFADALEFLRCLVGNWRVGVAIFPIFQCAFFCLPVAVYYLVASNQKLRSMVRAREGLCYGALLTAIVISSGLPGSFIYFQF